MSAPEGAPEKQSPGVFLDSDNLMDLSFLLTMVRDQTDTLVVLCTQEILFRL